MKLTPKDAAMIVAHLWDQPDHARAAFDYDEWLRLLDRLEAHAGNPDPEGEDSDTVDGLIAKLQALPPNVRKLPVVVDGESYYYSVKVEVRDVDRYMFTNDSPYYSRDDASQVKVVVL